MTQSLGGQPETQIVPRLSHLEHGVSVTGKTKSPGKLLGQDGRHLLATGRVAEVQGVAVGEPGETRVAGRQHHRGLARGGDLAALVLGPDLQVHQGRAVVNVLADDAAPAPLGVAVDVEAAALNPQALQESVVAHPVGDQRSHPRDSLGAVIVGARNADRLGH